MTIKIIQIGAGLRGSHWLEYVRNYADAQTVAVVDPLAQALNNAKEIVKSTDCSFFESIDEALSTCNADAAIIASPSQFHAQHALQALEADLAVLIEKPFATNVDDACQVIRKSDKIGKPVMIGENFRFVPAERTIRKLMQDQFIGRVHTVTLADRRRQPAITQGPWVANMKYAQLQEIAIHHFDSLRGFFECLPLNISIQVYNPDGSDYRHGACTKALIEMEGGIHISYLGTLTSHRYSYLLHIEGESGELWTNRKWVMHRKKGKRFFMPLKKVSVPSGDGKPYPREGTTSLLNDLRDAVLKSKRPETNSRDNIWNVAMVQAGIMSAERGETVDLSEVLKKTDLLISDR
jgi:predicted dehydrogenase